MDVLFVNLMEWAKEQGYSYFNLGMSPLSRVGENSNAHREERFPRLAFQYVSFHLGVLIALAFRNRMVHFQTLIALCSGFPSIHVLTIYLMLRGGHVFNRTIPLIIAIISILIIISTVLVKQHVVADI